MKHVWEKLWSELPNDFPREDHAEYEINHLISNLTTGSVLDVGCASGLTFESIVRSHIDLDYVGLDFTKKYLLYARTIAPDIPVINASAFYLPFPDKSFDTVFCKSVLEHQDPDEYFEIVEEMIRVAREQILIAWFKPPHNKKEVIELVQGLHSNRYDAFEFATNLTKHPRYEKMTVFPNVNPPEDTLYQIILNK